MGFRFRKRIKLAKGLNLNISKSGLGLSAGVKGLRVGMGSKGVYSSAGIPGTGLSMMSYLGKKSHQQNYQSYSHATNSSGNIQRGFTIKVPSDIVTVNRPFFWTYTLAFIVLLFVKWWIPIIGFIIWMSFFSKNVKAQNHIKKANRFVKNEEWSEVIRTIMNFKQDFPESKDINAYLGMAYLFSENNTEGVKILEEYLSSTKEKGNVRVFLANTYYEMKEYEKCLAHFDKIHPENKSLLCLQNMIADCYLQLNKNDLAIAVLENGPLKSKETDNDHLELHYLLCIAYKNIGNLKNAKNQISKVFVINKSYKNTCQLAQELGIA